MTTSNMLPQLVEAGPDPDTPAQLRATVARHLAVLLCLVHSSSDQGDWAKREKKYRMEWEEKGIWPVGVKVNTNLIKGCLGLHPARKQKGCDQKSDCKNNKKRRVKYTHILRQSTWTSRRGADDPVCHSQCPLPKLCLQH